MAPLLATIESPVLCHRRLADTSGATCLSTIEFRRSWRRELRYSATLESSFVERLWREPAHLATLGESLLLHSPRGRQRNGHRITARLKFGGEELVIKRYGERNTVHYLPRVIRGSRARVCWERTRQMIAAGVATPPVVACLEHRVGPLKGASYLVYRYVPGRTLRQVLMRESPSPEVVDDLARQFAVIWRQLHDLRLTHDDLHLANLVVDSSDRLWLIDLDDTRKHVLDETLESFGTRSLFKFMRDFERVPALAEQAEVFARHLKIPAGEYLDRSLKPRRHRSPLTAARHATMAGLARFAGVC